MAALDVSRFIADILSGSDIGRILQLPGTVLQHQLQRLFLHFQVKLQADHIPVVVERLVGIGG